MALLKRKPSGTAKYLKGSEKMLNSAIARYNMAQLMWAPAKRFLFPEYKDPHKQIYERFLLTSRVIGTHINDLMDIAEGRFEPRAAARENALGVDEVQRMRDKLKGKQAVLLKEINKLIAEQERRHVSIGEAKMQLHKQGTKPPESAMKRDLKALGGLMGMSRALLDRHPELKDAYNAYLEKKLRISSRGPERFIATGKP